MASAQRERVTSRANRFYEGRENGGRIEGSEKKPKRDAEKRKSRAKGKPRFSRPSPKYDVRFACRKGSFAPLRFSRANAALATLFLNKKNLQIPSEVDTVPCARARVSVTGQRVVINELGGSRPNASQPTHDKYANRESGVRGRFSSSVPPPLRRSSNLVNRIHIPLLFPSFVAVILFVLARTPVCSQPILLYALSSYAHRHTRQFHRFLYRTHAVVIEIDASVLF